MRLALIRHTHEISSYDAIAGAHVYIHVLAHNFVQRDMMSSTDMIAFLLAAALT